MESIRQFISERLNTQTIIIIALVIVVVILIYRSREQSKASAAQASGSVAPITADGLLDSLEQSGAVKQSDETQAPAPTADDGDSEPLN